MEYEDQAPVLSREAARRTWKRFLLVLGASLLCVPSGYLLGRAMDCSAGQADGQCGLASFLGLSGGVLVGGVLLLVGTIHAAVYAYQSRRRNATARNLQRAGRVD